MNLTRGAVHNPKAVERLFEIRHAFWLPVRGSSMEPGLRTGDHVLIDPAEKIPLFPKALGTVVLLVNPEKSVAVVHRIVGSNGAVYFERGDARNDVRPLKPEWIVGTVTHIKRNGRVRRLKKPVGWTLRSWLKRLGL
ncbi:hypothetical protein GF324_00030 [bacterium]|nr:hypothetical protein [bacterium]